MIVDRLSRIFLDYFVYTLGMGAPTVQGLTPAEVSAVSVQVSHMARYGTPLSETEVARRIGYAPADPHANAYKLWQRPRVQSALNAALAAIGATPEKVSQTYLRNLDAENPAHQLHAADSVARIMGEMGDRDRDTDGARSSVTNFTVVVVQPAASAIETIDAD